MVDRIGPAATCDSCGQFVKPPADGRWRWARTGKVYPSLEDAEHRVDVLNRSDERGYEFLAAVDDSGHARIASRRKPE